MAVRHDLNITKTNIQLLTGGILIFIPIEPNRLRPLYFNPAFKAFFKNNYYYPPSTLSLSAWLGTVLLEKYIQTLP